VETFPWAELRAHSVPVSGRGGPVVDFGTFFRLQTRHEGAEKAFWWGAPRSWLPDAVHRG